MDFKTFGNQILKSWIDIPGCNEQSDLQKGLECPIAFKSANEKHEIIKLTKDFPSALNNVDMLNILSSRMSQRSYKDEPISLETLSFLCYALHGVNATLQDNRVVKRPTPSGGGRHPFELYFVALNVEGLEVGAYHYLSDSHSLELLYKINDIDEARNLVSESCNGQKFCGASSVMFYLSAVPYRGIWRYMNRAYKLILLDAGHKMQNLDLAVNALGLGTCAIASLHVDNCNKMFMLDGDDEFIIYGASVGHRK